MKSHLPVEAIAEGAISLPHYVLNNVADIAAAVAAAAAQPPDALQEWHSNWQAKAFRVALRIAAIETWHWRQTPKKVAKPRLEPVIVPDQAAVRTALVNAQAAAGHCLEKRGSSMVTCRLCRRSAGRLNFQAWLAPCEGKAVQTTTGEPQG